jgi:hypothetical protein
MTTLSNFPFQALGITFFFGTSFPFNFVFPYFPPTTYQKTAVSKYYKTSVAPLAKYSHQICENWSTSSEVGSGDKNT